jgi:NAD(P)-dependent dehydrogenase (short-subunit alcohol dehydrogenase family)
MAETLHNKTVLIIGGGTGIGLVVAKLAANAGANVMLASRSADKLGKAAESIGHGTRLEQVDVTDETSVSDMFGRIGQIDHLVVTSRQTQPPQNILESDYSSVRAAFDVKFWGQYLATKHAAPHLSHDGSITLTSGTASQRAYLGYSSVAAMNAATEALAKNLAVELAPIRVNAVSPGFVDTEPSTPGRLEFSQRLAGRIPARRLATPQEIAEAYLFLMTNTYASGIVLVVDGASIC